MEVTEIKKDLLNFGYFKIDSSGIVSELSYDLCEKFGLSKNEIIGVPVEKFFTSQVLWKHLGKIEGGNKVVFGIMERNLVLFISLLVMK